MAGRSCCIYRDQVIAITVTISRVSGAMMITSSSTMI
jgi:hypothetical protein